MMFLSACYSISGHFFTAGDANALAPKLTITALFVLAAAQVQRPNDFKIFAATTVVVSLALSLWVISSAATLNFEAMREALT